MQFIDSNISKYIINQATPEPDLLKKINRNTHLKVLYPQMLSGHYVGRMLALFSQMIRPKRILEIGTFTGYSCLCLAEGLAAGGEIITLEKDPELDIYIRKALEEGGIADKVEVKYGPALELIPTLSGPFDLIFIDADKGNYLNYFEMILPLLRTNGFILADNTLWRGKILDPKMNDKETAGIRDFNHFVSQDSRVEQIIFPVEDGLALIRKK